MCGTKYVIWKDTPEQESWMRTRDKILFFFSLATGQFGPPSEDD